MANVKESLEKIMQTEGAVGACVVDSSSGMMLGSIGGGPHLNVEIAAAGNTEVVRAKRKTMRSLNLNDQIEDILITLGKQYHIIRLCASNDALFVYVVLDKQRANLAMARINIGDAEKNMQIA
jgi:predicted regulator of Ras-like GTPase activity (Roadblock/LC7/MglB family)